MINCIKKFLEQIHCAWLARAAWIILGTATVLASGVFLGRINFTALQQLDEAQEKIKELEARLALSREDVFAEIAKNMGCPADMDFSTFVREKLYNARMYEDRISHKDRVRMIDGFPELWEQVENRLQLSGMEKLFAQNIINTYRDILEENRDAITNGIKKDIDMALLTSSSEPGGTRISESTKHRAASSIFEHYLEP